MLRKGSLIEIISGPLEQEFKGQTLEVINSPFTNLNIIFINIRGCDGKAFRGWYAVSSIKVINY